MASTKIPPDEMPDIVKKMKDKAFPTKSVWAKSLLEEAQKGSYFSQFVSATETKPVFSYTQLFWCRTCEKPVDNVAHEESYENAEHRFHVDCHGERISCALSRKQLEERRALELFPIRVFAAREVRRDYPEETPARPSMSSSPSRSSDPIINARNIAQSRPKPKKKPKKSESLFDKPPKERKRSLDL
jgi:hypothetical protein